MAVALPELSRPVYLRPNMPRPPAAEAMQQDLTQIAKEIEKKHRVGSVIIFVTYQDGEKSRSLNGRAGNFYGSLGAVHDFIVYQDAAEAEQARQSVLRRNAEEDESKDEPR